MKTKVYAKLTLSEKEVRAFLPNAYVSPPVSRGDLIKDIGEAFNCIIIIDGKFHHSLAVSISEIMDALRCGVVVYGASSMGAMRAAELDVYGMLGYGKIYKMIKSQPMFRDDYLGQMILEEKGLIQGLSQAYIDFYFNLQTLFNRREIRKQTFHHLLTIYRELHYSQRNAHSLLNLLKTKYTLRDNLVRTAKKATQSMGSQKKRDAWGVLKKVQSDMRHIASINTKMGRIGTVASASGVHLSKEGLQDSCTVG